MTGGAVIRPVELYLGAAAAAGGPFALLALAPEDCTQELIIVQLQRQLKKLALHPEASSHAADEVRLALHAAAAQLLEGVPRDTAGAGSPGSGSVETGVPATTPSMAVGGVSPGMLAMERDIVATIAQYGGWNSQCLHRLALIAHSRGVSQEDFLGAIDSFRRVPSTGNGGVSSSTPAGGGLATGTSESPSMVRAASYAAPEEADPTPKLILGGFVAIVVVLALLGGAIYLVAALTGGNVKPPLAAAPGGTDQSADDGEAGGTGPGARTTPELFPTVKDGAKQPREAAQRPALGDVPALLRECREIIGVAAKDPSAGQARFAAAMRDAEGLWIQATPDQVAGLQDAVVEYVYRAGRGSEGQAAILACVSGVAQLPKSGIEPASVRAAVFSAGLIARLSRERELPGETADALAVLMRESFFRTMSVGDASFRGGATSACVELAERLTPRDGKSPVEEARVSECWKAWLECVDALGLEKGLRDRLVLQALDSMLRSAPEPTRNKAVFDGVAVLAMAFGWTPGEDSRGRLLRWFDDAEISVPDLHAVTMAVVDKGLVAGVDASMVMSAGAGDAARSELRDRYREAWGASGESTRAAASKQFLEAAEAALRQESMEGPEAKLAAALWYSRLGEVGEAIWFGKASPVIQSVPEIRATGPTGAPAITQRAVVFVTPDAIASSAWSVRYMAERTRVPERLALLKGYNPGPETELVLEASVIVEEAVRGSPYDIRRAASEVVVTHANEWAFVNALLNESSMMPLSRDNAALVGQVSRGRVASLRDPAFRVVARRSLVERLLELLSADGELGQVDAIGEKLAESYQVRSKWAAEAAGREAAALLSSAEGGADTDEGEGTASGSVPAVERSARLLRLAMDDEARRHLPSGKELRTLEGIRQDRVGRTRAAQGRMQQLVAEQAGLVDVMAYLVVSESPSQRSGVQEVLDAYTTTRRGAGHVAEQVEAGERAMLKLWVLRLRGEGA